MLVVQEIVSVWHKSERGGENSEARSRFPYTANIERKPGVDDECVFDHVRFYQSKNKFYTLDEYERHMGFNTRLTTQRAYEPPVKLSQLKVRNVSFSVTENGIEAVFSYDPQLNGRPCRKGHNKDYNNISSGFYGKDILNETAFLLKDGQKGRIMYNGRFSDYDTGQWWYEQTAVNIANISYEKFRSNVFSAMDFDFEYCKLAVLK